jgi:hypothetical protein
MVGGALVVLAALALMQTSAMNVPTMFGSAALSEFGAISSSIVSIVSSPSTCGTGLGVGLPSGNQIYTSGGPITIYGSPGSVFLAAGQPVTLSKAPAWTVVSATLTNDSPTNPTQYVPVRLDVTLSRHVQPTGAGSPTLITRTIPSVHFMLQLDQNYDSGSPPYHVVGCGPYNMGTDMYFATDCSHKQTLTSNGTQFYCVFFTCPNPIYAGSTPNGFDAKGNAKCY